MTTVEKGYFGEDIAITFLQSRGYSILYRNWRCYYGEIDIIAVKDYLIFFEVKTVYTSFIKAHELFTAKKRQHLLRSISIFFNQTKSSNYIWRLDLICIDIRAKSITHFPNV